MPSEPNDIAHPSNLNDADQKILKPKRVTVEQIRDEARKIYPTGNFGPNIRKAEELIRQALGKAPRQRVRKVLEEPQFKNQRRPPGNQAKI
jgi:hypothetical protein